MQHYMEVYLAFLSVSSLAMFVFLGYRFSRQAAWAVVITLPLLGPGIFSIVPSASLPLTINRAAIAVTLGALVRDHAGEFTLRSLVKCRLFLLLVLFLAGVLLKSFDDRFVNTIFTWIPNWICPFILCFLLVQDKADLRKLTTILSWQTGIIAFFVLFEFLTKYNIGLSILHTNPNPVYSYYTYERSAFYRPAGLYLDSVFTGYYFAFAFPVVLWQAMKTKITGILLALISLAAIAILQTRAAYLAVFVSILLIFFRLNRISVFKLCAIGALSLFLIVSFESTHNFISTISEKTVVASFTDDNIRSDVQVDSKLSRIPKAISFFLEKPLSGYLSPVNTLWQIMDGQDLPSPVLYLLSGGFFLFIIYMLMISALPLSTFALSLDKALPYQERLFLFYMAVAFFSGILVVFSNACEDHFPIMFMLYASIYKVYVHNHLKARFASA